MSDIRGEQPGSGSQINGKQQLDSWKEIAAYVHRTVATVKRWEKKEKLPVHRHLHDKRSTVYAYPSEIDIWLGKRGKTSGAGRFPFSKSLKIAASVVILLLVALVAYVYQSDDLGFQDYSRSAYELVLTDGDLDRAKPYLDKALELLTPEDFEGDHDTAIELMWLPAFEALLGANPDPELALSEADRPLEMLRSFEGGRFVNDSPMGALYLTLGKIERARRWFQESTEPGTRRQVFLTAIAYVEEDHTAMTEHLEQVLKAVESLRRTQGSVRDPDRDRIPLLAPTAVLLLTRGGLQLPKADNFNPTIDPGLPGFILERIERRRGIRRGMLAVNQGNRIEGMRMLGDALLPISLTDSNSAAAYFMGSEILAEAWREQGDSTNAVAVLRVALEKESFLLLDQSVLTGPLWLRLQAQLAQLYREMGQDKDAREIEDKLRRLLALADSDHPILHQLDRHKELALREAAN